MRAVLRNEAKRDLRISANFYEDRRAGLGDEFYDYIDEQLAELEEQAGIHSKLLGLHCKSLRRFPFAIYYLVQGQIIDIVAIVDQRMSPKGIGQQLRRRQRE